MCHTSVGVAHLVALPVLILYKFYCAATAFAVEHFYYIAAGGKCANINGRSAAYRQAAIEYRTACHIGDAVLRGCVITRAVTDGERFCSGVGIYFPSLRLPLRGGADGSLPERQRGTGCGQLVFRSIATGSNISPHK